MDEVVDISAAIRNRYRERPASTTRCLKLSMTDGIQRVFGIEYRPIKDLNVFSPAGLKVSGILNFIYYLDFLHTLWLIAAFIP